MSHKEEEYAMVKAAGKLRTFDVELRRSGCDPRLVATDVSIDVAREMCRDLVGPSQHAVVRRRDGESAKKTPPVPKYAIWLWSEAKMCWERVVRRQAMTLSEATEWLQARNMNLEDRLVLLAPAHLTNPVEMLRHAE